ncbi:MAG: hypothetical protein ACR2MP_01990 [Streptosporangiaceae bacterium]
MTGIDPFAAAWAAGAMVDTLFADSLVEMFRDPQTGKLCREHLVYQSGPNVALARDHLVRMFLATDLPWLLMLDSDMVFTPGDVLTLLGSADPDAVPIVGGDYLGYIPATGVSGHLTGDVPADTGLYEVDLIGTGFLLTHRTVFEALASAQPQARLPWFQEEVIDGEPFTEDWVFCVRARAAGFPVHCHGDVRLGHCKRIPLYLPQSHAEVQRR